jgi:hypothetical protein
MRKVSIVSCVEAEKPPMSPGIRDAGRRCALTSSARRSARVKPRVVLADPRARRRSRAASAGGRVACWRMSSRAKWKPKTSTWRITSCRSPAAVSDPPPSHQRPLDEPEVREQLGGLGVAARLVGRRPHALAHEGQRPPVGLLGVERGQLRASSGKLGADLEDRLEPGRAADALRERQAAGEQLDALLEEAQAHARASARAPASSRA